MERDERRLADDLDRYWDTVRGAQPSRRPTGSVADLTELVDRLHAEMGRPPHLIPDPHRAWRELQRQAPPHPPLLSTSEVFAPSWPNPNGRAMEPASSRQGGRHARATTGWVMTQLATAALLLITLAAAYVAIRQQTPEATDEARWVPALVRALESAPGGVVDEVLIEATFTPEELPAGEREAIFYRLTLPPGATLSYLAGPSCGCPDDMMSNGVGSEVVQSGTYSVRLDAPFQVQRSGSSGFETVPAQTEITLGPGDAAIFPNYAATGDIRNVGDDPVVLVGVAIVALQQSGTPVPVLPDGVQGEELAHSLPTDWNEIPPGPLNVSLRQLTLPPDTRIGPYEAVGLESMRVESGVIYRSFFQPGSSEPTGRPLFQGEGRVIPFIATRPGMRNALTSSDGEPTELLVLIIEPAGIRSESLAP